MVFSVSRRLSSHNLGHIESDNATITYQCFYCLSQKGDVFIHALDNTGARRYKVRQLRTCRSPHGGLISISRLPATKLNITKVYPLNGIRWLRFAVGFTLLEIVTLIILP